MVEIFQHLNWVFKNKNLFPFLSWRWPWKMVLSFRGRSVGSEPNSPQVGGDVVSREWTKFSPSWWWRGQWGLDQILPKSVVTWIVGSGSNSPGWDRLWQDVDRWKEAAGDSGSPRDFLKICSEGKDSSCSLSFVSWTWNLIALFVLCGIYNRIFILSSSEEFIDVKRYLSTVEK